MKKLVFVKIFFATLVALTLILCCNTAFVPTPKKVIVNVVYDSTAYKSTSDTIIHLPTTNLTWGSFLASPKPNTGTVANSAVGFKFTAGITSNSQLTTVNIYISAFFIKSKSWGIEKNKTPYILNHEQQHFNIARYGAELLKRNIESQKYTDKNISENLNKAYGIAWTAYLKLQDQYDTESNHSIIKPKQEQWGTKIKNMLLEIK